jgi:hypothetical protein
LTNDPTEVELLLQETDELIRIFVTSVRTAENNKVRESCEIGYGAEMSP